MQVVVVLVGLVAFATVLGMLWRSSQGRVRFANGHIADIELGGRATLLQLSSEVCAPCRATARVLGDLSDGDVRHVEVDINDRPDLVSRFNVLQTPTTFILDRDGAVRARIGGAVRRELVVAELEKVA
ncbi:MAG: thioredoxin family protein [Pseudolysinimonas sp.]